MRDILRFISLILLWSFLAAATPTKIPLVVEIKKNNITVRAEEGMLSIAREVATKAPRFLEKISVDLPGLDVPGYIEIRLVHQSKSLPLVAPAGRGAPHWASGVAYSDLGIIAIAEANGTQLNDVLSVTAHELSHLALGSALHGKVPRWLNEGFAYIHSSDWSSARTQTLTGLAWSGNTIPLRNLETSFPAEENEVHKAYAQSYDMVAFLARRGRYSDKEDEGDRWPFRNFLRYISEGESLNDAALRSYGVNMVDLYKEWYEDLRSRYLLIPSSLFGLMVWCFAALLLVIGYFRKRRITRRIMKRWAAEDHEQDRKRLLALLLQQDDTLRRELSQPTVIAPPNQNHIFPGRKY